MHPHRDDAHLAAGGGLDVPSASIAGAAHLLYVVDGSAAVEEEPPLAAGEALQLPSDTRRVEAIAGADLVLLATNEAAPVFKGGMFSGDQGPALG